MKRFYKTAAVRRVEDRYAIELDGRPVRTPAKNTLTVPFRKLAEALAGEWMEQGETVDPPRMRLSRLANTAIDRVAPQRAHVVEEIVRYAVTDLVCYRAEAPDELVVRQAKAWQPLVDWVRARYDAAFTMTDAVLPVTQPESTIAALREAVAGYPDFPLTGLHAATTAAGSVVIGLALAEGVIDAEAAWERSLVDEIFQMELWGEDDEAVMRQDELRADLRAAAEFLRLTTED